MSAPLAAAADSADWRSLLADRWWRLNHLYRIKNKQGREVTMRWNEAQTALYRSLHTRNVIPKARQRGFTTAIAILGLDQCIFNSNQSAGFIAHKADDANEIFEDKIRFAYDRLPAEIKALVRAHVDRAGQLRFANGSVIRASTSFRGGTLQFLHISEAGKLAAQFPHRAEEVRTGAIPAVAPGGIIFMESTAEGAAGLFWDTCKAARDFEASGRPLHDKAWKLHFFPWWGQPEYRLDPDSAVVPKRLLHYFAALRRQGIELDPEQQAWYAATEAELGTKMFREYPSTYDECFKHAVEGAYYARQFERIRVDGRIARVPPEPGLPVDTWWDLGLDDCTAIWFVQTAGREVRVIDYYQAEGEGLAHYAEYLRQVADKRGWTYGRHVLPHDVAVRELGTGKSRQEILLELGVRPLEVAPRLDVHDGIESVRRLLHFCWFDEAHCEQGLQALEAYQREWDQTNGQWRARPMHNWASHAADAFRYGAVVHHFSAPGGGRSRFNPNLPRQAVEE